MSRYENRNKITVEKVENEDENLKGRKIITGASEKVEKEKKMFYLSKILTRALEIYAFEKRKNASEICTAALKEFIPIEVINRAEKEFKTL